MTTTANEHFHLFEKSNQLTVQRDNVSAARLACMAFSHLQ